MEGIIVRSTGSWYEVWKLPLPIEEPEFFLCQVRGNFRIKGVKTTNPVAVGDQVDFEMEAGLDHGWITHVHERKNALIRKSVNLSKRTHILAANVDRAFCILSLCHPRTPWGFVDRFLVSCEAYHVPCTLVFNKIDLYNTLCLAEMEDLSSLYEKLGYPCLHTSVPEHIGITSLQESMQNRICLFSGNSGVGKSALANTLSPQLQLKEGFISETHLKGKHTTTFAQMFRLPQNAFLIDTPGIKELGLVNINTEEISRYFPEMRARQDRCRFNNCTHEHEPGCLIKEAVKNKDISEIRYKSYLNILHGEEVESPNLLLNKQEKHK